VLGSIREAVTEVEVGGGSTGGVGAVAEDGLTAGAVEVEVAVGSIAGVMGAEVPGSIAGRGDSPHGVSFPERPVSATISESALRLVVPSKPTLSSVPSI
jgi:hypothetical protein